MSLGEIIVVNKHTDEYDGVVHNIQRGRALGNPIRISPDVPREVAISRYKVRILDILKAGWTHPVRAEVNWLVRQVLEGQTVYLECSCKPLPCHGDVIKEIVDKAVEKIVNEKW